MGCSSSRGHLTDEDDDDELYVVQLQRAAYRPSAPVPVCVSMRFQLRALIGKGAFSEVVRADERNTHQPYAVKIVSKANNADLSSMQAELNILGRARHPNVVRLFDHYETDTHAYMVLELATGGELYDRIVERGSFSEVQTVAASLQILKGLSYLHRNRVVHCDLKPENILCYHAGPHTRLMISDFGLSKILEPHCFTTTSTTTAGSPEYIAPEVLAKKPFGTPIDMWAMGVIAYVMLAGYLPFDEGKNRTRLFEKISRADYAFDFATWDRISRPAKDFVAQLMLLNPKERLTAKQAQAHAWIVGEDMSDVAGKQLKTKRPLKHRPVAFQDLRNLLPKQSPPHATLVPKP